MSPVIAYDILRLAIGPAFLTPRGIDRVDLALARYVFSDVRTENVGVLPTPIGTFCFPATKVRLLLGYLEQLWAEVGDTTSADVPLQTLLDKIALRTTPAAPALGTAPLMFRDKVRRMLRMLGTVGLLPRRLAARAVPAHAVYLNIGQLGLAVPSFYNWLEGRPDLIRAMMLHDAIPLDYPHLVGPKAPAYHRQMIQTAALHADCLIYNSSYTRDRVGAVIKTMGREPPPDLVRALPLPPAFLQVERGVPDLLGTRYFLAVSTIEPRKNFALLLRVWQRLLAIDGEAAPHLVIVGSPGNDADAILAPLKTDPGLACRVHPVAGVSSAALASLTLGATAMLIPSLAEGFGLPLLEASALGVPTIASDIPAHRELATATSTLLPPHDDEAWTRAIAALPDAVVRRRPLIPVAMTEAAYCTDIITFLSGIYDERVG